MTIQAQTAIATHVGNTQHPSTQPTPVLAPTVSSHADLQQLATAAARIIQQKLRVDLVWIGEVAPTLPRDLMDDDDDGCGPPDVTVLATATVEPKSYFDRVAPVLPDCLTQIAWDVAMLGTPVEMTLRTPTRALAAFPVTLHSGAWLVLIVVAPHNALTRGDIRTLNKLVTAIGRTTDAPVDSAQS